ncbi:hypothetical protein [Alkalihalobacterium alkalinitrilicum]|nr:hypothetical protein [Alkalihalobacterium alkalinitrilicum]
MKDKTWLNCKRNVLHKANESQNKAEIEEKLLQEPMSIKLNVALI